MNPSLRKPVGVIALIAGLIAYCALIASLAETIGTLNVFVQGLIYLIAGVVWILPLRPLLLWMETGRWR